MGNHTTCMEGPKPVVRRVNRWVHLYLWPIAEKDDAFALEGVTGKVVCLSTQIYARSYDPTSNIIASMVI
jgi:hypothetical protein